MGTTVQVRYKPEITQVQVRKSDITWVQVGTSLKLYWYKSCVGTTVQVRYKSGIAWVQVRYKIDIMQVQAWYYRSTIMYKSSIT